MINIGVDRTKYTLADYHKEALHLVRKLSFDKNADCKLRMAAIVFCKNYDKYFKESETNE